MKQVRNKLCRTVRTMVEDSGLIDLYMVTEEVIGVTQLIVMVIEIAKDIIVKLLGVASRKELTVAKTQCT